MEVKPSMNEEGTKKHRRRTRRGGRGRRTNRRRAKQQEECQIFWYGTELAVPWWWTQMHLHGLTPMGIDPSFDNGYPVVLPSRQEVFILPKAKNAAHARTYAPFSPIDEDDHEEDSQSTISSSTSTSTSSSSSTLSFSSKLFFDLLPLDAISDTEEDEPCGNKDKNDLDPAFLSSDLLALLEV